MQLTGTYQSPILVYRLINRISVMANCDGNGRLLQRAILRHGFTIFSYYRQLFFGSWLMGIMQSRIDRRLVIRD